MKELEECEAAEEESEDDDISKKDAEVKKTNNDVLKIGRYVDFMGNILKIILERWRIRKEKRQLILFLNLCQK